MNSTNESLTDENVVLMHHLDQILEDRTDSLAIANVHIDTYGTGQTITESMVLDHFTSFSFTLDRLDLLSQPSASELLLLLRQVTQYESLQEARLLRHLLSKILVGSVDVSIGLVFLPNHQRVFIDVIGQAAMLCKQARNQGYGGIVHATALRHDKGADNL